MSLKKGQAFFENNFQGQNNFCSLMVILKGVTGIKKFFESFFLIRNY